MKTDVLDNQSEKTRMVFIVSKALSSNPSDSWENVGVFFNEADARKLQEELINENAVNVINLGSEPIDVSMETWEVEE